jgi:chromosome segregation ATPase
VLFNQAEQEKMQAQIEEFNSKQAQAAANIARMRSELNGAEAAILADLYAAGVELPPDLQPPGEQT